MKHTRLLGFIGMLTIGLTAACGGSSDQETSTAGNAPTSQPASQTAPAKGSGSLSLESVRNDPCQMVTQAEAEAIFGRAAQAPSKVAATGTLEAGCYYSVDTQNMTGAQISQAPTASVSIMFSPERARGGMDGKKYMQNARQGVAVEPVTGLADEAFCADATMIFARTGDIVLAALAKDCGMARQFAEKALARL